MPCKKLARYMYRNTIQMKEFFSGRKLCVVSFVWAQLYTPLAPTPPYKARRIWHHTQQHSTAYISAVWMPQQGRPPWSVDMAHWEPCNAFSRPVRPCTVKPHGVDHRV